MVPVREVLADCESEQVKALIEEHNKAAILLRELAAGQGITDPYRLPRPIVARR